MTLMYLVARHNGEQVAFSCTIEQSFTLEGAAYLTYLDDHSHSSVGLRVTKEAIRLSELTDVEEEILRSR